MDEGIDERMDERMDERVYERMDGKKKRCNATFLTNNGINDSRGNDRAFAIHFSGNKNCFYYSLHRANINK